MYQKYLAEGEKIILELIDLKPYLIDQLYALPEFLERQEGKLIAAGIHYFPVAGKDLERISNLKTPQNAIAVIRMQDETAMICQGSELKKVIYLDEVRDPGNLGTIIRSADWFGWDLLVLSNECVDPYNPKVVQASMGSLFRLPVIQSGLQQFLDEATLSFVIYSAEMDGASVYETELAFPMLLIMGNESHGVKVMMDHARVSKVSIPRYNGQTESLNVAIACSVMMAEINRRSYG
ncbi:MAG TPA: RNA methyltransferase [Saprospiraceae bacterium]|nr:RNA methyltransferase [Saprospiraceae bacterium]